MGMEKASYRKKGERTKDTPHARAMHQYQRRAAWEVAKAIERRDGSKGAASEVRKVEVTPEMNARYVQCNKTG